MRPKHDHRVQITGLPCLAFHQLQAALNEHFLSIFKGLRPVDHDCFSCGSGMKVVVCGGGVVGCSIAYFLAKRGVACSVVERCGIACAASGKAGACVSASDPVCGQSERGALERWSFRCRTITAALQEIVCVCVWVWVGGGGELQHAPQHAERIPIDTSQEGSWPGTGATGRRWVPSRASASTCTSNWDESSAIPTTANLTHSPSPPRCACRFLHLATKTF